ncbi:unnamed protein product [Moneuplotes crassus]|uniref:Uncharacterized protein n=1 Tax=Euplotes crassus TaxID=5936 RepID=A0AAD1UEJ0_EUPCR|nr:unnamed protein product [Moneuplotes crassus]
MNLIVNKLNLSEIIKNHLRSLPIIEESSGESTSSVRVSLSSENEENNSESSSAEELSSKDIQESFDPKTEILNLQGCKLRNSKDLARFLRNNKELVKQLILEDAEFIEDCDDLISQFDSGTLALQILNLNYCNIGVTHTNHILESFCHVTELKEIYMRGHDLVKTNKMIGKAFITCKNLEILDISDNAIELVNQRCLDALQDLIANSKKLSHLIMNDVIINEEEGINFLDSFHMNSTIISWEYEQHPSLTKETIDKIEKELSVNKIIHSLIIENYDFDHPSNLSLHNMDLSNAESIIKFLKCNTSVYDVDLSQNLFDDKEIGKIIDYIITKKRNLHSFNLSFNHINIAGCQQICKLFYKDAEVLNIDLSHNPIENDGFMEILKSLKKNMMTRKLYLNECGIKYDDEAPDVIECLKRNCSLIALSLGGNVISQGVLEAIEEELSCNRGINDLIAPMFHDNKIKNHQLSLAGRGISNLDFLAKFIRENPQITGMNLEVDDFHENEIAKVAKELEGNTGINQFTMRGNKKRNRRHVYDEDMSKSGGLSINVKRNKLNKVEFLVNYLKDNRNIQVLDLSNNNIGNKGVKNITKLLETNEAITEINLSDNNIGTKGLNNLCSALSYNKSVVKLDIRRNPIPWGANKILLALLHKNPNINEIKYSHYHEEVKDYSESIPELEAEEIRFQREFVNRQIEKNKPKRSKCSSIFCCIYYSFADAKEEAFRFRYCPEKLALLEESMDWITWILYINAALFYFICIFFPIIFAGKCGHGISIWSHLIYTFYAMVNFAFEFFIVVKIQRQLDDPTLLALNRWHFVEALMGQIARVDFYTDICFIVLLTECHVTGMMIPTITSITLMLIYPIYKIFRLIKIESELLHTLPKIERNCKLSFIRENMMLAVVLDSFCITNYEYLCKKNIFFPRIMGAITLFFQDIPQLIVHMIFLFFVHTHVPHSDLTVTLSLVTSVFAIMVSSFNVLVSHPNHFDPLLLRMELDKRKRRSYRFTNRNEFENWRKKAYKDEDSKKQVDQIALADASDIRSSDKNATVITGNNGRTQMNHRRQPTIVEATSCQENYESNVVELSDEAEVKRNPSTLMKKLTRKNNEIGIHKPNDSIQSEKKLIDD